MNVVSSLTIPLNGIYGLYRHWHSVETKYLAAFAMFIVVGFGSAAFHGTLWRSMQLMDELPMCWANSIFTFIIITMEDDARPRKIEAFVIAVVTVVISLAIIYMDAAAAKQGMEGSGQDVFLVTYGAGVIYLVVRSKSLDFKYNSKGPNMLLETSLFFYAGGFLLWLIDRSFCASASGAAALACVLRDHRPH